MCLLKNFIAKREGKKNNKGALLTPMYVSFILQSQASIISTIKRFGLHVALLFTLTMKLLVFFLISILFLTKIFRLNLFMVQSDEIEFEIVVQGPN